MENRTPVMSRTYEKGQHREAVFIYLLTGPQITGTFFRFAVLLDNTEQESRRVESGNRYEIRRKFINYLLDLTEDGWKRVVVGPSDPEHRKFFELDTL